MRPQLSYAHTRLGMRRELFRYQSAADLKPINVSERKTAAARKKRCKIAGIVVHYSKGKNSEAEKWI